VPLGMNCGRPGTTRPCFLIITPEEIYPGFIGVCDGASTSIAAGDEVTIEGFPGPMVGDKT